MKTSKQEINWQNPMDIRNDKGWRTGGKKGPRWNY